MRGAPCGGSTHQRGPLMQTHFGAPQLPGFHDRYLRLEFALTHADMVTVATIRAAGPGFAHAGGRDVYELLSAGEALDVAAAVLDGFLWPSEI